MARSGRTESGCSGLSARGASVARTIATLAAAALWASSNADVSAPSSNAPAPTPASDRASSLPPAFEHSLPAWFDDALIDAIVTTIAARAQSAAIDDESVSALRTKLAAARASWLECRRDAVDQRLASDDGRRCADILSGRRAAESVVDAPTILATCRTVAGAELDARRCDVILFDRIATLLSDFGIDGASIDSVLRLARRWRAVTTEPPMGDLRAFVDLFAVTESLRRQDPRWDRMLERFSPTPIDSMTAYGDCLGAIAAEHEGRIDGLLRRRDERQHFTLTLLASAPTLEQLERVRRNAVLERREQDREALVATRETARRVALRLEAHPTAEHRSLAVDFLRHVHWAMAPRLIGPTPIDAAAAELRKEGTGDATLDETLASLFDDFARDAELLEARVIDLVLRGSSETRRDALAPETPAWRIVADLERLCRTCNNQIAAIVPPSIADRLNEAIRRHRTTTVADRLPRPILP